MVIDRFKKAEIKEIENTTTIRDEAIEEHEREPEVDIRRTNFT